VIWSKERKTRDLHPTTYSIRTQFKFHIWAELCWESKAHTWFCSKIPWRRLQIQVQLGWNFLFQRMVHKHGSRQTRKSPKVHSRKTFLLHKWSFNRNSLLKSSSKQHHRDAFNRQLISLPRIWHHSSYLLGC